MELGFAKVVLILIVFLGALSMDVNGARLLKPNEEVDHPQTFPGFPGFGGTTSPSTGLGGTTFPSPGLGGTTFPSPGLGGSFPSPSLGGSFPSPSLGGSFPSPSLGSGGPLSFCSFPGAQCAPAQPNIQSGSNGGDAAVSGSP